MVVANGQAKFDEVDNGGAKYAIESRGEVGGSLYTWVTNDKPSFLASHTLSTSLDQHPLTPLLP
jgi:hypothetical protein